MTIQSRWAYEYQRKRSAREMFIGVILLALLILLLGIAGEEDRASFGDGKSNNELRHQVLQRVVEVGK